MINKENRKSFIKSCRRNGYSYARIGRFLNVSRQRVDQILRPDRRNARDAVRKYYDSSVIHNCEYPDCKKDGVEAHHFDYSRPLDVNWLCIKHHKEYHSKPKQKKIFKCVVCLKELLNGYSMFCEEHRKKHSNKKHRLLYKNSPLRREAQKQATKNWVKNNPERYKIIQNRAVRNYQKRNPEKKKAMIRKYQESHREMYRELAKKYYQKNKEYLKAKAKERYYKKKLST